MTPYNVVFALAMGAMNRWRGMSSPFKKFFPRPLPQITLALPYAILVSDYLNNYYVGAAVLVLTTLGWLTGHGAFIDLGTWKNAVKPERLEFTITWLKSKLSPYWYDFVGLAVTGLAVTVPAGIATMNPVLALSGVLKAPAYAIGWFVSTGKIDPSSLDEIEERIGSRATEIGEFLTGLFLGAVVSLYLF